MKAEIHPEYVESKVTCSCGNNFTTRSTKGEIHVELCSQCHPFYTGKQKLVDTGGRVERFQKKYAKQREAVEAAQRKRAEGAQQAAAATDERTQPDLTPDAEPSVQEEVAAARPSPTPEPESLADSEATDR